ncbi:hypothetical protein [Roseibium sp. RKSG952]|uniref:hypothetical protein n=1 Tax=Roseibium sp. RKSG952 TaxID=2529384 RepID=UPI0012BBFA44|nr:hypothetical protein [Roseibium sp. RKSG952]MTH96686.1 hypothetical protein [Roseibium sp. RKSG952]
MASVLKALSVLIGGLVFGGVAWVTKAPAQVPFLVTSPADSGPGTLRAALEAASLLVGPGPIFVVVSEDIETKSPLTYSGRAPIAIHGIGQTVRTSENINILQLDQGADLFVAGLKFMGPGGFSVANRGDRVGSGGKGIFIDVRKGQSGTVNLVLRDVLVTGVAYHGVHVSDCDLADACGGGSAGGGSGAPASINIELDNVEINGVGQGVFDADGIRVDERGDGDIHYRSAASKFLKVGADGVELDEGGAGSIFASVSGDAFVGNGNYCDPEVLGAAIPVPHTRSFQDGQARDADIPKPVTGSADDRCIEREVAHYPSGSVKSYAFNIDFDDGIDLDEAGAGELRVSVTDADILQNRDEGLDLDEYGEGDVILSLLRSRADGNTDDGVRVSEGNGGRITGLIYDVVASGNGDYGLRFDQAGPGDVMVDAYYVSTVGNGDGVNAGIRVAREGAGKGVLTVFGSTIEDGLDVRNVELVRK